MSDEITAELSALFKDVFPTYRWAQEELMIEIGRYTYLHSGDKPSRGAVENWRQGRSTPQDKWRLGIYDAVEANADDHQRRRLAALYVQLGWPTPRPATPPDWQARLFATVELFGADHLPTMDPFHAAKHGAFYRFATTFRDQSVPHIGRDVDPRVDAAIDAARDASSWKHRLVVITGDPFDSTAKTDVNAGKTYAAVHAITRRLPGYTLLQLRAATSGDRLADFADAYTAARTHPTFNPKQSPRRVIVFIDDLHNYLRPDIPFDQHLRAICEPAADHPRPLVVVTCRSAYVDRPEIMGLDHDVAALLERAPVRIPLTFDPTDKDPVVDLGLAPDGHVTQQLAGRDDIQAKLDYALAHPCREAMIAALLTAAASGHGIPLETLRDWHASFYQTLRGRRPPDDCFPAALKWTDDPLGPPAHEVPQLVVEDTSGLRLSDTASDLAPSPPHTDLDHPGAMSNLGVLLDGQGRTVEAVQWYERAAAHDHRGAMSNLGVLLDGQGRTVEAEQWFARAAAHDHPGAMHNLGVLLAGQGRTVEAVQWYERAAAHDHPDAMHNLGVLLAGQGRTDEAEQWYERAAAHDHPMAMTNLGVLLAGQGRTDEAEQWYERAAAHDHPMSMSNLGVLLDGQGRTDEAEQWYERAAAHDHPDAMSNLGVLLAGQGRTDEAEQWYERAAAHDHPMAMTNLGVLLAGQGRTDEAEQWYERAAAHDHPDAMSNLGLLLAGQGRTVEAEQWFARAAAHDHPGAMHNLGVLLAGQGRTVEAEQWYERAAAHDNAGGGSEI